MLRIIGGRIINHGFMIWVYPVPIKSYLILAKCKVVAGQVSAIHNLLLANSLSCWLISPLN